MGRVDKIKSMNRVNGKGTLPIGFVYPHDSHIGCDGDYSPISVDLDENHNTVILDFAFESMHEVLGASVSFRKQELRAFIHMLQAGMESLLELEGMEEEAG